MFKTICIFVLLILSGSALIFAQSNDAILLRSLLTNSNCQKACFMGIEPGRTTRTQFLSILASQGITPEVQIYDNPSNATYYWDSSELNPFKRPNWRNTVLFGNDIVHQMYLFWDISPQLFIQAFGSPEMVYNYDNPSTGYTFLYQRLGISIPFNLMGQNDAIFLAWRESPYQNQVNSPVGTPVNQACPTYGTPPCFFPTATPTPTPIPPTLTSTATPTPLAPHPRLVPSPARIVRVRLLQFVWVGERTT